MKIRYIFESWCNLRRIMSRMKQGGQWKDAATPPDNSRLVIVEIEWGDLYPPYKTTSIGYYDDTGVYNVKFLGNYRALDFSLAKITRWREVKDQ